MTIKSISGKKIFGVSVAYMLIGALVLTVVGLLIRHKIKKTQKLTSECAKRKGTWDKKQKKCIMPAPNSQSGGSSQNTGIQWTPNVLASEISRKIEGYNAFFYYDVAERILALTDAQLRVLYAYYNKNYAVDYPTITQLFANEWDDFYFSKSPYDMVVDRFKSLGLY